MELGKKLGEMAYDGLITNLTPPVQVFGGTICKLSAEATYPRGTLLAKSTKDGKLYILGTTAASGDTLPLKVVVPPTMIERKSTTTPRDFVQDSKE